MTTVSKKYISFIFGILLLCLTPQLAFAAPAPAIDYTLVLNGSTYEVYMRPNFTPAAGMQTLTSQVTVKVPHSAATPFTVNSLFSPIAGVTWSLSSRVDAPTEDPTSDYLSFSTTPSIGTALLAGRTANTAFKIFTFQNTAACIGPVTLMDNTDSFNTLPNSAGTNPGNQIDVLGFSPVITGDIYGVNYGTIAADCTKSDLSITIGQPSPSFKDGVTSSVPVTVTNSGSAPAGPVTVTVPLPTGVTAPATFNPGNGWSCTSTASAVSCINPGPINPGTSSPFTIPMTPGPAAVGTTPVLTGTVSTPNDNNPANDNATPVTTNLVPGSPDVVTTIGQPAPALQDGVTSQLPVTVTNQGTAPTTGPITTTVALPTGVTAPASFTNNGWSCTTSGSTVTCVDPTPLANGSSSPFSIPLTTGPAAVGTTPTFTGTTTTPGDKNPANNNPAPTTVPGPVAGAPDVVTTIGQPSPALQDGVTSNLPVTVTNQGTAPTTGPVTTTVSLPTGVTAPAGPFTSGAWTCTTSGSTVTCVDPSPIAAGVSSPFSIPLTTGPAAVGTTPTITGTTTTPGDKNPANNNPTPVTTAPVAGSPDVVTTIGQPSPVLKDGVTSNLPVTVTNQGTAPTTGPITTTVSIPAGVTTPASFSSNGWNCTTSGSTVTCVNPGPIAAGASKPFSIPLTSTAAAVGTTPVITGTTTTPGDKNPGNNNPTPVTPTGPIPGSPDVVTAIGQPSPALKDGVTSNLPVTVTNQGSAPTTGPITTTVSLPTGVTAPAGPSTSGAWSCTTSGSTVTCVDPTPLANGSSSPFSIPLTTGPAAVGTTPTFTGTTTTPGDKNPANNNPAPTTVPGPVAGAPDVVTTIGQPSPALKDGVTSNLPVTVTNQGTAPTTGPVTTTVSLPTGVTAPAGPFTSGAWTCTTSGSTVTCVDPSPIAAGVSSPLSIPLTTGPAAVGTTPTITGTTTTPGDKNPANNNPTPVTTAPVAGSPDVVTTIGQPSPALQDGVTSQLPVTVTNQGTAPTTGPVTTTVSLPTGVTAPAGPFTSGAWTCTTSGSTVTCVDPSPIAAGVSSPLSIPLTTGPAAVGTTPTITGTTTTPGDKNPANNNPAPTTVPGPVAGAPDVVTTIGQPSPALQDGVTSNLPVTVTNQGTAPTTGPVTTTISLPTGVTAPAGPFTSGAWTCTTSGSTVTCVDPSPIAAGVSSPLSIPVTPNSSVVGTTPTFTGTTTTPGDKNPANNNPAPLTAGPVASNLVILPIKVFLGGAYNQSAGLMRDDLRVLNLIPTTEPYTGMTGFTHMGGGGGESVNSSVFSVTGANAIVDWVFVELRSSANTVVATRSALVQRDGDVVGVDGVSSISLPFSFNNQSYFIAVRHRNHLGVMTAAGSVLITNATPLTDFTVASTALYGTNAEKVVGAVNVLWSGNTNVNKTVINAGPSNDVNPILNVVLTDPNNDVSRSANYIVAGYRPTDVNMDGKTIAAGPNNDINPILANIFLHPANASRAANYIIQEQRP